MSFELLVHASCRCRLWDAVSQLQRPDGLAVLLIFKAHEGDQSFNQLLELLLGDHFLASRSLIFGNHQVVEVRNQRSPELQAVIANEALDLTSHQARDLLCLESIDGVSKRVADGLRAQVIFAHAIGRTLCGELDFWATSFCLQALDDPGAFGWDSVAQSPVVNFPSLEDGNFTPQVFRWYRARASTNLSPVCCINNLKSHVTFCP